MWVILLGMVIPQIWFTWHFGARAAEFTATVQTMTERALAGAAGQPRLFRSLVPESYDFAVNFGIGAILVGVLFLVSYLALIRIALDSMNQRPARTLGALLLGSLKIAVPRGILLVVLVALTMALGQIFIILALIVSILALMSPVLLVAESKGAFAAFGRAITLRYARKDPPDQLGVWPAFFALMTVGGLFYVTEYVVAMMSLSVLQLDTMFEISRNFWTIKFPGLLFGPAFVSADMIDTTIGTMVVAVLPSITAALYFKLRAGVGENIQTVV